jgi:hypothetical protein
MADIEYLKGLQAVRERAHIVLKAAERDQLTHFSYHAEKMPEVADYVACIIKVRTRKVQRGKVRDDFGPSNFDKIPPHGRWQHFDIGGIPRVDQLIKGWQSAQYDDLEITRRLIDLFFVAVLLDAGAGDVWSFTEPGTGNVYGRSEGIAVAALYMFKAGTLAGSGTSGWNEAVDGKQLNSTMSNFYRANKLQATALPPFKLRRSGNTSKSRPITRSSVTALASIC